MRSLHPILASSVAIAALLGGGALVLDPSGGGLGLPVSALEHTPFPGFLIPGLLLTFVVGGSQLAAALAPLRGRGVGLVGTGIAGGILVGWILIQIVLLRQLHWLQGLCLGLGLVQLVGAVRGLGIVEPREGDEAVAAFLGHHRIAFVGLSPREGDFSGVVAAALREHGHEVLPINPRAAAEGVPGYHARVGELEPPAGAALLMVPPSRAEAVVADCLEAGIGALWFHRGVGPGSASPEAVALARRAGVVVVTDACPMMFLQPVAWFHRAHRVLRQA